MNAATLPTDVGEQIELAIPRELNLGCYFLDENLSAGRAERIALQWEDGACTFRELWQLTNRFGNVLKRLGVEPGNRVLLVLENSPEWVAGWFATMKVGGVGTHAYTYLTVKDYAGLFELVRPKVVVADAVTLEKLREACNGTGRRCRLLVSGVPASALAPGEFHLGSMLDAADDRLDAETTHCDDLAFWNFSGGTTGVPKGVPHMHRDGLVCFEAFDRILHYRPDDVVLGVPKFFFHYSRDAGMLFPLRNGARVVLFRQRTTAALIFELIRKYRPTVLLNVPTMMRAMIDTAPQQRGDLRCLRYCMSSGEALPAALHEQWLQTFGVEVFNRYGSAESAMGVLNNRPGFVVPGSTGTVAPLVEARLIDRDGAAVACGETGRLLVRCPTAGRYYVRDHEKSIRTFLGDGWIDTGDLFRQDASGYFWNMGRADDLVKVSGVWVAPLEVERTLEQCPEVRECAVLGVSDDNGLTKLKAFVSARRACGDAQALEERLKLYCRERLAAHKVPRFIEFMDELPRTGQGKIDRSRLRDRPF